MNVYPGIAPPITTLCVDLTDEGHLYRILYQPGDEGAVLDVICQQVNAGHMSKFNAARLAWQLGAQMAGEFKRRMRELRKL